MQIGGTPPTGIDTRHPLDEDGWYEVAEYNGPRPFRVVFRRARGGTIECSGGQDDRAGAEAIREWYQSEYDQLRAWWNTLTTAGDRAYARQRFGR